MKLEDSNLHLRTCDCSYTLSIFLKSLTNKTFTVISVRLCNFKDDGSYTASFWPEINILKRTKGKKEKNVSLSKIGHDFGKLSGLKIHLENNVFNKKWSPKLIFLYEKYLTRAANHSTNSTTKLILIFRHKMTFLE